MTSHAHRSRDVRWRSHAVRGGCRQSGDVLWARRSSGDLPRTRSFRRQRLFSCVCVGPWRPRRRTFHGAFSGRCSQKRFSAFMASGSTCKCARSCVEAAKCRRLRRVRHRRSSGPEKISIRTSPASMSNRDLSPTKILRRWRGTPRPTEVSIVDRDQGLVFEEISNVHRDLFPDRRGASSDRLSTHRYLRSANRSFRGRYRWEGRGRHGHLASARRISVASRVVFVAWKASRSAEPQTIVPTCTCFVGGIESAVEGGRCSILVRWCGWTPIRSWTNWRR